MTSGARKEGYGPESGAQEDRRGLLHLWQGSEPLGRLLTWGSMLVCSSGAEVSGGGMVMDRLGGFRLCRRLLEKLDTEETLSPFLSAEAMVGRGSGGWNADEERGHRCVEIGRTGGATRTQVPVWAEQPANTWFSPNSGHETTWQRPNLAEQATAGTSISVLHLHARPVGSEEPSAPCFVPFLVSAQARTTHGRAKDAEQ